MKTTFTIKYRQNYIGMTFWKDRSIIYYLGRRYGRHWRNRQDEKYWLDSLPAIIEHEASTTRISEDQLFYLKSRGLDAEEAVSTLVSGFCKEVFKKLPLEFSVEAVKLIEMKLENAVG